MKVLRFISAVKIAAISFVFFIFGCGSLRLPVDPNRGFYGDVQSNSRSFTRAMVRTDKEKFAIASLSLEACENRIILYGKLIAVSGVDYSKLRINRIYNRYVLKHPKFKIDESKLVSFIVLGIREIVGPKSKVK